jgi:hypothetical protein
MTMNYIVSISLSVSVDGNFALSLCGACRRSRYLEISGHDLVDGTPILDIKPYVPYDRVKKKDLECPAWVMEPHHDMSLVRPVEFSTMYE